MTASFHIISNSSLTIIHSYEVLHSELLLASLNKPQINNSSIVYKALFEAAVVITAVREHFTQGLIQVYGADT
jgi:hypothetical protein